MHFVISTMESLWGSSVFYKVSSCVLFNPGYVVYNNKMSINPSYAYHNDTNQITYTLCLML